MMLVGYRLPPCWLWNPLSCHVTYLLRNTWTSHSYYKISSWLFQWKHAFCSVSIKGILLRSFLFVIYFLRPRLWCLWCILDINCVCSLVTGLSLIFDDCSPAGSERVWSAHQTPGEVQKGANRSNKSECWIRRRAKSWPSRILSCLHTPAGVPDVASLDMFIPSTLSSLRNGDDQSAETGEIRLFAAWGIYLQEVLWFPHRPTDQ